MDPKKFDACKDKIRMSVVQTIDQLLTAEWDRLLASIGAVTEMDETFPLTITVNLTPHEGGIFHAAGLKYKCSREAEGTPGFVRYDGTETVQGDLFEGADDLADEVADLADSEEWHDFDEFMDEARNIIMTEKSASYSTLVSGMTISPILAEKTLQLLEVQGFLGPRNGDEPRDIVSLRPAADANAEPVAEAVTSQVSTDDPVLVKLIEKGFTDKEAFLNQAKEIVTTTQRATATIIQRRLQVSFAIAMWALETLQERGIVTGPNAEGKRDVITVESSNAEAEGIANG